MMINETQVTVPLREISQLNIPETEKLELAQKAAWAFGGIAGNQAERVASEALTVPEKLDILLKPYEKLKEAGITLDAAKAEKLNIVISNEITNLAPAEGKKLLGELTSRLENAGASLKDIEALTSDPEMLKKLTHTKLAAVPEIPKFERYHHVNPPLVTPPMKNQVVEHQENSSIVHPDGAKPAEKTVEKTVEEAVEKNGRKWFQFATHNGEGAFSGKRAGISAVIAAVGIGIAAHSRKKSPEPEPQQETSTQR